jgi:hypothetical protein
MYGIPSDFDPRVFVGRTLISVTFAENLIAFNFDDGVLVTAEGEVEYVVGAGEPAISEWPPIYYGLPWRSGLAVLVGRAVVSCSVASGKVLHIFLSGVANSDSATNPQSTSLSTSLRRIGRSSFEFTMRRADE